MDEKFWITFIVAALASTPVFWLLSHIDQGLGYVPSSDALMQHGRRYAVWWEEPTLIAGDMICFALMDAAVISGLASLHQPSWKMVGLVTVSVVLGITITVFWLRGGTSGYANAVSWGWQWCGPTVSSQSVAGAYHTLYFCVQATFIVLGAILLFHSVSWSIRGFYLLGVGGYALCFLQFIALQKRFDAYYIETLPSVQQPQPQQKE